jgi:hypothetical protein
MHWALITLLAFDLAAARNEPNLEKRSDLALKNADVALTAARDAYKSGDFPKVRSALAEVGESVELCYQSLSDSGKDPRGSRYYKRAELDTRQLMRRLDGLRDTMSVVDQEVIDPVRMRVAEIHDRLLTSIMTKKKK